MAGPRAMAWPYVFLGLIMACFALFALTLDPATLQLQGQRNRAATVMEMRRDAEVLLLLGAAQVLTAIVAAVGATSRIRTVLAQLVSLPMAAKFAAVFAGLADLAFGHSVYHDALVFGYVIIFVPVTLLFVAGLFLALVD